MAASTTMNAQIAGVISRLLPALEADGIIDVARLTAYGDQYAQVLFNNDETLTEEGCRFVATNPTIGTGVANALVTAFSALSGAFVIINTHTTKNLWVKKMRLMLTAVGTASVSQEFAFKIDAATRFPSLPTGAAAITPVNTNQGSGVQAFSGTVYAFSAAAITLPAESAAVTVGRVKIPTGINVVGDVIEVQFGPNDIASQISPLTALRATQPARFVANAPAFCIPPGKAGIVHRWALTEATTALSMEYHLDMVQR